VGIGTPPADGGPAAIVSLLTEELVKLGHDVTLFAAGDSQTTAKLRAIVPAALRSNPTIEDPNPYEWTNAVLAIRQAGQFDIIHNHAGEIPMLLSNLTQTPMLTTCHGPLIPDRNVMWDNYQGYYNTISKSAKLCMPDRHYLGVVYNAIDVHSFPFCQEKEDYLLFLSRMSEQKGPHRAIEVARRLGRKLILAWKIDPYWDGDFFERVVMPEIDGRQIIFVGEANASQKRELYRKAACLLLPITWDEPFGLVMVEAMACGTPVIAFNRGSVQEVIAHGKTGFIVEDVDEMAEQVTKLDNIDSRDCRDHVLANFHAERMVQDYLAMYRNVLARSQRSAA
jgi:glycosyltransferase involved in cell wall biosynthesis